MNCLRTTLLLAALTALFMGIGYLFGGASGALLALLLAAGVNFLAYWNADNLVLMMHGAQEVDAGDRTRSMRACAPPSISCWIAHAARLPHGQSSAKRVRDRSQSRPRSRCSDDLDPDEFRKRRSAPQGCQLEG
jgi:Zn-dependent protease with chaperone function